MLFPGLGQFYAKRYRRAFILVGIYIATTLISGFLILHPQIKFTLPRVVVACAIIWGLSIWILIDAYRCITHFNKLNHLSLKPAKIKRSFFIFLFITLWFFPMDFGITKAIVYPIRTFIVESFIIPTGTMADTLLGHHFRILCDNCEHSYNYNFEPHKFNLARGTLPTSPIPLVSPRSKSNRGPNCPLCGFQPDKKQLREVNNGDRLLVSKSHYRHTDPKRWDVIVFKNPTNPQENYIKRLIGHPGEKVEILDGDIYINGQIQTKPEKVQQALWIKIWDNNHQPLRIPARVNDRWWDQPFSSQKSGSAWTIDQKNHTFSFESSAATETLEFNPTRLWRIAKATTAYNGPSVLNLPNASDLMLSATLTPQSEEGSVSISLGKYLRNYRAQFEFNGQCTILNESTGEILVQKQFSPLSIGQPTKIFFSCLDHTLQLQFGSEELIWQGPNLAEDWGYPSDTPADLQPLPTIALVAQQAKFTLRDLALYRDIHYTDNSTGSTVKGRATSTNPFEPLGENEHFVLGDNSCQTFDSRFWKTEGIGENGRTYRTGIVPREYIIGKAYKIYWPPENSGPIW